MHGECMQKKMQKIKFETFIRIKKRRRNYMKKHTFIHYKFKSIHKTLITWGLYSVLWYKFMAATDSFTI